MKMRNVMTFAITTTSWRRMTSPCNRVITSNCNMVGDCSSLIVMKGGTACPLLYWLPLIFYGKRGAAPNP